MEASYALSKERDLILAEKSLAVGARIAQVAAVARIAYGTVVIFRPGALESMTI